MARRFVSIWLPCLVTDWHIRKQPQLHNMPFVLKAPVRNRIVVTAVSPAALSLGIRTGTTLADAKALVPSLQALEHKLGLAEQLLQRMAEWCIRFTPVAAPDPLGGLLLDASGCAHLWGGEDAYLADICKRLTARGYSVRAAMADTIGAAWAVARYGNTAPVVDSGHHRKILLSLPVSSLRLEEEMIVRLHKLGLRQIKDVMALPQTSLRRRFGAQLIQRINQALGDEEECIQPVYPPEPFQERLPCLEPIRTLTGIEIALHHLLAALCDRLRKEGKGLRSAFFRVYRVDGGTQGIEIGTNRSSHNEEHLFHLFSLKLSTIEPKEGIELFLLEATKVEDATPLQESLWEEGSGLQDPRLAELVDRLAGKLGQEAICRYLPAEHWWPERSFKKAASLDELPAAGWKLDRPRPLQLLSPPERIDVTAPIPDYPPMLFRYKGSVHKIVKADGPERIEQEWWIQDGKHRDYYCVEDEEGRRYWLFRSGHYNEEETPSWFLHGFFA
ncbi:Y-family DNA polymerase [Flavisolibacter nicotianae]|uniref:Y-family DNA polymerase n=1 Tax=Flavisolibacter nicotianae TaxID=2364882 RepID=UPI000EAF4525|nr:DNA polymerase Y family protein [Flavisolibacter nicotianae]